MHGYNSISRLLFRLLGLLTVLCLLIVPAGCGSAGNDEDDDISFMEQYEEDPSGDPAFPAQTERTVITFLFPGYPPRNWDEVKEEIEKRTRNTLNVELNFKWKEQYSYISEIKTLQASNQDFDAFVLAGPDGSAPDFTKLARSGVLKDLTEIFPQSAPSLYKKYGNEELQYATIDGKLYAVPSLTPMAESPVVITDDSLLKKYRIDDITDFEQYEAFLKKVTDNEPGAIPAIDTSTFIASLPSIFGYATADERSMLVYKWDDPKMRLTAWERTPEFYDTVSMFIDWHVKGYLKPMLNAESYMNAISVMVGAYLSPPSKNAEKMSFSNNIGTTIETGPVRALHLYPEKIVQRKNPLGKYGVNGSFAFTKESKNAKMALRFLEWVHSDRDNYNLVVYGIEGKDHVIKDGMPALPGGMSSLSSSYMYWGGHWAFSNIEYEVEAKKVQDHIEYLDSHSAYPPHGVFYPDFGALDQIADKRAKGFQEFYGRLATGQVKSVELLDKFIANMEAYGTDELINMAQDQLTGE